MTVEIPLPSGHVALVDDEDWPLVASNPWHVRRRSGGLVYAIWNEYLGKTMPRRAVHMHHVIMQPTPGFAIDHRNGNGLDNRRQNLRLCTHSENMQNRRVTTGRRFKGVSYHLGKYQVVIVRKYLGRFSDEIEAATAYDQAAKQMFGEFARLNFPDGVSVCHHASEDGSGEAGWIRTKYTQSRRP